MKQQRHIVKKQILELNLSSQKGVFELQNDVSRIYRYKIIPLIDDLLSQFSNSDTIYRVDWLEIDLGNIDINSLEEELIEKTIEEVKLQLEEKLSSKTEISTKTVNQTDISPFSQKDTEISTKTVNQTDISPFSQKDVEKNRPSQIEIFSYFLQTGTLPWWTENLTKQELEEYCDRLLTNSPERVKSIIIESLKNAKQLQRLIYQFSDSILLKIAGLFSADLVRFIADYNTDIKGIFKQLEETRNIPEAKLRLEIWQGILLSLSSEVNIKVDKLRLIQANLLHIATSNGINYPDFLNNLVTKIEHLTREGKEFKSTLPEILDNIKFTQQDTKLIRPEEQANISLFDTFSDSDEIYICNAGLILLWPFLNRFFVKIGLVQENLFINIISAQRATLLLQYLVDNSTEIPEHTLPLNKILCGIDLLEPIETNLEITEPERAECENLLSAVIQNWSILKNTSVEGLRKAFLQRNGILRIRDRSWLLQVERETYDILLDKIPWSIRVVKLPWMDNLLYVEW